MTVRKAHGVCVCIIVLYYNIILEHIHTTFNHAVHLCHLKGPKVLNLSENVNICSTCLVVFDHITSIRSVIYARKDSFGLTWFFRVKLSLVVTFLNSWCSDHIFHRVVLNIWKVAPTYNEVVLEKLEIDSSIAMATWLQSYNPRILSSACLHHIWR